MTTTTTTPEIRTGLYTIEVVAAERMAVRQHAAPSAGQAYWIALQLAKSEGLIEPDAFRQRDIEKLSVGEEHWIYGGEDMDENMHTVVIRIR